MNVNKEYRRCKRAWKWQKFCEVWERRIERFFDWLNRYAPPMGALQIKNSPCFKAHIKERIDKLNEQSAEQNDKGV